MSALAGSAPPRTRSLSLGAFCEVRAGYAFPPSRQGRFTGDLPFLKVSDMNLTGNEKTLTSAKNWIDSSEVAALGARPFPRGAIVFPKVGAAIATNKKRLLSRPSLIDNNVMAVIAREDVCLPEYMYFWFLLFDLSSIAASGPLPSLTAASVKALTMPLPALDEQRRIASILTTVQQAFDATARELHQSIALRAALARELFVTRGGGWRRVALRDVAEILSGGTPPKADPAAWIGSVPWVSPKDMASEFLTDAQDHITDTAALEHSTTIPAGSSLVAVRGMALAKGIPICFAETPMAFNQDLKGVVPGPDVDGRFLFYAMQASRATLESQIGTSAHGTKRIGGEAIENWQIALPSMSDQLGVSKALDAVVCNTASVQRLSVALRAIFLSALHDLVGV
jgi:type I restriction enzyme, S subunit